MNALELLLVEDDPRFVVDYKAALENYVEVRGREIEMRVASTLECAKSSLDGTVDAAIVDLNLGRSTSDGGAVIDELKNHFRVPVAVLTGTPTDAVEEPPVVGVYTKGKHGFDEVLDRLWGLFDIGLTEIMGGRGLLEERLNRVFLANLLPTIDMWMDYGRKDKEQTKKALLRYTLGHLAAELEADETPFYAEEVYLAPPLKDALQTGTLVRRTDGETSHVVMTPACDLVIRPSGRPKTDIVVVAEVVPQEALFESIGADRGRQTQLRRNNDSNCFHWLPQSGGIGAGFVDFRRLETAPWEGFERSFQSLNVRIAPSFLKDLISRFSTFYARQGQPAIRP